MEINIFYTCRFLNAPLMQMLKSVALAKSGAIFEGGLKISEKLSSGEIF